MRLFAAILEQVSGGKKEKSKKVSRMVPGTDVPYENWIQAWGITERMKRKKIDWLNVFVWFGSIPIFTFLFWYGVYKLAIWLF